MAFTYDFETAPQIAYVRLLISDTDSAEHVFEDSEILAGYSIQQSQFQSSMLYSGAAGQNLPSSPVSYLRVAALLLDSLAANKSKLASIKALPDIKLDAADAAIQLRATAKQYRDVDDNAGAFCIIEQCNTDWAFRDRFWSQVQRQAGN